MTTPAAAVVRWDIVDPRIDLACPCGYIGHYLLRPVLRCEGCDRHWKMPNPIILAELEEEDVQP